MRSIGHCWHVETSAALPAGLQAKPCNGSKPDRPTLHKASLFICPRRSSHTQKVQRHVDKSRAPGMAAMHAAQRSAAQRTSCAAAAWRCSTVRMGVLCAWLAARFLGGSGIMNSLLCPSLHHGAAGRRVGGRVGAARPGTVIEGGAGQWISCAGCSASLVHGQRSRPVAAQSSQSVLIPSG
jgi:hypothetical protein